MDVWGIEDGVLAQELPEGRTAGGVEKQGLVGKAYQEVLFALVGNRL